MTGFGEDFRKDVERQRRRVRLVEYLIWVFAAIVFVLAVVGIVYGVLGANAFVDCMDRVGDVWACLNR